MWRSVVVECLLVDAIAGLLAMLAGGSPAICSLTGWGAALLWFVCAGNIR